MHCTSVPSSVTSASPRGRFRHFLAPLAFQFSIELVPSKVKCRIRRASSTRRAFEESNFTRYRKLQLGKLGFPWSVPFGVLVNFKGVVPPNLAFDNKLNGYQSRIPNNMVMGLFTSYGCPNRISLCAI